MLTQEQIKNLFDYDAATGKLSWKDKKEQLAGTKLINGYRQVSVNGKRYLSHHLIWLIFHGELPKQLDHVNRNKSDNRIENLRECNSVENMQNRKSLVNTSSCYKGVRINKQTSNWRAVFTINGISNYLGEYCSEINAALAHDKCAIKYKSEFTYLNFPELENYWQELLECNRANTLFSKLY